MKQTEAHIHKFTRKASQKVQVMKRVGEGGTPSANDTIKMRVCTEKLPSGKVCGKTQAYDLERVLA